LIRPFSVIPPDHECDLVHVGRQHDARLFGGSLFFHKDAAQVVAGCRPKILQEMAEGIGHRSLETRGAVQQCE